MDEVIEAQAQPKTYGLFGLVLSLVGVAAIATGTIVLCLGLAALVDGVLFGWPGLGETFRRVAALASEGSADDAAMGGLLIGAAIYLALIFGVVAMARLRGGKGWRTLLAWAPFQTDRFFWALLLGAVLYQMAAGSLVRLVHPEAKNWLVFPDGPLGMASAFLLVVVLAPIAEELLFRGWVYTALRFRYGFSAALWVTAVLFALAHWESTHLYALAILPMGLALGYLRERMGSTKATILFHMVYNCAGLALSFLGKL